MPKGGFEEQRLVERRRLVLIVDAEAEPDPQHALAATPRRSGRDRRVKDRRSRAGRVDPDRRSGADRRKGDRRSGTERRRTPDRRRETPAAFSREEAGLILQLARTPGALLSCPRCRGRLVLRPPVGSLPESVWQIRCVTCHRCVMVKNL